MQCCQKHQIVYFLSEELALPKGLHLLNKKNTIKITVKVILNGRYIAVLVLIIIFVLLLKKYHFCNNVISFIKICKITKHIQSVLYSYETPSLTSGKSAVTSGNTSQ